MRNIKIGTDMKKFFRTGVKMINTSDLNKTNLLYTMDIIYKLLKSDIYNIHVQSNTVEYSEYIQNNIHGEIIDLLSVFMAQHINTCAKLGIDSSKVLAYSINKEYKRLINMIGLRFSRIITKSIYPKFEDSHKAIFEFKYESNIVDYIYDNIITDIQSIKLIFEEIQNLIFFTVPIIDTLIDMKSSFSDSEITTYKSIKSNLENFHVHLCDVMRSVIDAIAFDIIDVCDNERVEGYSVVNNVIFSLNSKLSRLKSTDIPMDSLNKAKRSLQNKIKINKNNYRMLSRLYDDNICEDMVSNKFYTDMEFKSLNSIIHVMYILIYSHKNSSDVNVKYLIKILDMYKMSDFTQLLNTLVSSNGYYKYDITIPYAKNILLQYEDILNDKAMIKINTSYAVLNALNISCDSFINQKWYKRIFNKNILFDTLDSFYDKIIPIEINIFGTYNCIAIRHIKAREEMYELMLAIILDDGDDDISKEILDVFITSSLYGLVYFGVKNYMYQFSECDKTEYTYNISDVSSKLNISEPDIIVSCMDSINSSLTKNKDNDDTHAPTIHDSSLLDAFHKNKEVICRKILLQHSKLLKLYNNK